MLCLGLATQVDAGAQTLTAVSLDTATNHFFGFSNDEAK